MKKKWFIRVLASALLVGVALVGTTLAYLHASDKGVKNTFEFAQVSTSTDESGSAAVEKEPVILNTGKSPVYVRARAIVVSGEGSDVLVTEDDVKFTYTDNWLYGGDGYYYYNAILQPGKESKTDPLFSGVSVTGEKVKNNPKASFSVGVYHESALAPADVDAQWDLGKAKAAFAKADSSGTAAQS